VQEEEVVEEINTPGVQEEEKKSELPTGTAFPEIVTKS